MSIDVIIPNLEPLAFITPLLHRSNFLWLDAPSMTDRAIGIHDPSTLRILNEIPSHPVIRLIILPAMLHVRRNKSRDTPAQVLVWSRLK
jgi:hypothetical protein